MTATLTYTDSLFVVDCCECGMTFGMPTSFEKRRRDDHKIWFCPAGHQQHFAGRSEQEKAAAKVVELERQLASRRDDIRHERERTATVTRSLTATKGQLTRAKARAEKGLCQHCHRHFVNVQRHMEGQHAEKLGSQS